MDQTLPMTSPLRALRPSPQTPPKKITPFPQRGSKKNTPFTWGLAVTGGPCAYAREGAKEERRRGRDGLASHA
jgi:hypothetical protein